MSFLAPLAFWIAALVIPALLILYFLKLRRRQEIVSSTLLWRRAVQDLQVNAPFQRLRKSLLLLLQLLILAAGVVALARPVVRSDVADDQSVVILLDRSASMKTIEPDGRNRFEQATEQAERLIRTLRGTRDRWWSFFSTNASPVRVMVITFAERAEIAVPFTTNLEGAIRHIRRLRPTEGRSNIAEALQLAEAYMTQTTLEQTPESAEQRSHVVLISDGAVTGGSSAVLHAGRLTLIPIGRTHDNVGITALRISRNYQQPTMVSALLQVQNFGPQPVSTDVSLYVDGVLQTVQSVTLGPARADSEDQSAESTAQAPGSEQPPAEAPPAPQRRRQPEQQELSSASLSFEFPLPRSAVIEARIARSDALLCDNSAFVLAPAPRRLRVLLVSAGNFFLESALGGLNLEQLELMTPQQYESAPESELAAHGQSRFDLVIFDKHSTARLPLGNYFFLGAVPQGQGIEVLGEGTDDTLQWWDETHPVLRSVALDYVIASKGLVVKPPPRAEILVEGRRGPVLLRYAREGRHFLILTFAVERSTWWNKISFPKFMQNAVLFMGAGGTAAGRETVHPGEPLRIALPGPDARATLVRPDGQRVELRADQSGYARYADTDRVGVYRVEGGLADRDVFTVNLESPAESDIRVRKQFALGGTTRIEIGEAIRTATPEVWRWFVGLALVLALVEWYIYNRRVMI